MVIGSLVPHVSQLAGIWQQTIHVNAIIQQLDKVKERKGINRQVW